MTSPIRLYQQEMHSNLGFFPTWLPADRIEIGDVGVLADGRFRQMTSLAELGIVGEVNTCAATQDVQYTSTRGVSIATTAGAVTNALGNAEVTVGFSRAGAFVFHASRLQLQNLENRAAVGCEILKVYEKGRWRKEWLLVESLYAAERATIIVSEDNSAELVLVASAQIPLPSVSLSDPKVSLTVSAIRGKVVHILGKKGIHPLYSCLRLKDPPIGSPSVQPVRGAGVCSDAISFSRPSINELIDS